MVEAFIEFPVIFLNLNIFERRKLKKIQNIHLAAHYVVHRRPLYFTLLPSQYF